MPSKATAGPKLLRSPLTSMAVSMCRLYGSAANTGRTQAVIPLLGPAGHPGGRDLPGAAYQREARNENAAGGGAAAQHRADAADHVVRRPVRGVRRGAAGHRQRGGGLVVPGDGRCAGEPGAAVRSGPGADPPAAGPADERGIQDPFESLARLAGRIGDRARRLPSQQVHATLNCDLPRFGWAHQWWMARTGGPATPDDSSPAMAGP